jgi:hypothetical protein
MRAQLFWSMRNWRRCLAINDERCWGTKSKCWPRDGSGVSIWNTARLLLPTLAPRQWDPGWNYAACMSLSPLETRGGRADNQRHSRYHAPQAGRRGVATSAGRSRIRQASLAHELNQPIAAAVTDANTCLRWLSRDQPDLDEARAAASRMAQDGRRAGEIVKRLRWLFKKGTPDRELVEVNEILREMMLLLHSEATQYAVLVRTELAVDIPQVMGDRVQLQQVLMNLMINSIDAMKGVEEARELTIQSQTGETGYVLISVRDSAWACHLSRRTRSLMRSLPPRLTARVWDCGSAGPLLNRTGVVVGCLQFPARRNFSVHPARHGRGP